MHEIPFKKWPLILLVSAIYQPGYSHDAESGLPFAAIGQTGAFAGSLSSHYESRYFSEGRDSLDGDGIWINSIEFGYASVSGALWYGDSPSQDYDELQLSLAVSKRFGKVDWSMGFTYLDFLSDNSDDAEFGVAFSIPGLPWETEFGADIYYSFEAGGYFAEVGFGRTIVESEFLNVDLIGLFGLNQGYVVDGHDGANHLAVRMEVEIPIADRISINLHTAYSWAIDASNDLDGDLQLIDFFHANAGLTWEF